MPIYKGSVEVTSGNLYKGSTEIQDGYKASDSFYVNQTTLTIQFVNNTGLSISEGQLVNTLTGVPGQAINNTRVVLSALNSQRLNSLSFSESGDTGGNLNGLTSSVNFNGGTMNVSGTFPTTTTTVVYTLTANITNLTAITAVATSGLQNLTGGASFSAGTYINGASTSSGNTEIKFQGWPSVAAAQAAVAYVSGSFGIQPFTGNYTLQTSPTVNINYANPGGAQYEIRVNGTGSYDWIVGAGGNVFGAAGQSASLTTSLSKASGYYVSSGSTSATYMNYV